MKLEDEEIDKEGGEPPYHAGVIDQALSWCRRVVDGYVNLWFVALIAVAFPLALLRYLQGGVIERPLLYGAAVVIVGLLVWLDRRRKAGSIK